VGVRSSGPVSRACGAFSDLGLLPVPADDDPSGIATYSQAGAQFGFSLAWTLLFTYPLMVVIQAISARIGPHDRPRYRRQHPASLCQLGATKQRRAAIHREYMQHWR